MWGKCRMFLSGKNDVRGSDNSHSLKSGLQGHGLGLKISLLSLMRSQNKMNLSSGRILLRKFRLSQPESQRCTIPT